MIIVYVTCKDGDEAKKIAKHLLGKKLIACANILDSNSLYNWEGELKEENESVLLMKTIKDKFDDVKSEVEKIHSYDTPCVLSIDVDSNSKYQKWVESSVKFK